MVQFLWSLSPFSSALRQPWKIHNIMRSLNFPFKKHMESVFMSCLYFPDVKILLKVFISQIPKKCLYFPEVKIHMKSVLSRV